MLPCYTQRLAKETQGSSRERTPVRLWRRDGLRSADWLQAQGQCQHGHPIGVWGNALMASGDVAQPEAAAGPAEADAQPAMRILQWQPSRCPNFCSLFKRGFYWHLRFRIPCDPSCSRALTHGAGGTTPQAPETWQISPGASPRASRDCCSTKASSPLVWEGGTGTCPMDAAITDTGRELWAAVP